MRTVIGFTGALAMGELAARLCDPEADDLMVEIGRTPSGGYLLILETGDLRVLITRDQAMAACRAIAQMIQAKPERHTVGIDMLARGLQCAIENWPGGHPETSTVH